MPDHEVFVYGTLKRGFPNFAAGSMADAVFLGDCRTLDRYPLVVGGRWFTPYLIDEPGSGHCVSGELFRVTDPHLAQLDAFESVNLPNGYVRKQLAIALQGGSDRRIVWAYLRDRRTIEGIHDDAMQEYPLDPRYVTPDDPRRAG